MKYRMFKTSLIAFIVSAILLCGSLYAKRYMDDKVSALKLLVDDSIREEKDLKDKTEQMKDDIEQLKTENKDKIEEFELWQHQNEKLEEVLNS